MVCLLSIQKFKNLALPHKVVDFSFSTSLILFHQIGLYPWWFPNYKLIRTFWSSQVGVISSVNDLAWVSIDVLGRWVTDGKSCQIQVLQMHTLQALIEHVILVLENGLFMAHSARKTPTGWAGDSELNDGAPSRMKRKWPASWSEGLQKCDGNGSGAHWEWQNLQLGSHISIWSYSWEACNWAAMSQFGHWGKSQKPCQT
jgi:hypothetical protein